MPKRNTYTGVMCPLDDIDLDDCKKCPLFNSYDSYTKEVDCDFVTEREKKMAPEPTTQEEYDVKW